MTKKDFELIAKTLNKRAAIKNEQLSAFRAVMAYDFADTLARTNPNFDRARFLKACGVEG